MVSSSKAKLHSTRNLGGQRESGTQTGATENWKHFRLRDDYHEGKPHQPDFTRVQGRMSVPDKLTAKEQRLNDIDVSQLARLARSPLFQGMDSARLNAEKDEVDALEKRKQALLDMKARDAARKTAANVPLGTVNSSANQVKDVFKAMQNLDSDVKKERAAWIEAEKKLQAKLSERIGADDALHDKLRKVQIELGIEQARRRQAEDELEELRRGDARLKEQFKKQQEDSGEALAAEVERRQTAEADLAHEKSSRKKVRKANERIKKSLWDGIHAFEEMNKGNPKPMNDLAAANEAAKIREADAARKRGEADA